MTQQRSILEAVAERLVQFRAEEGLALEEAAEEAEIDYERLAAAENAELALREDELARLAGVYGIEIAAIFGGRVTPIEYLVGGP